MTDYYVAKTGNDSNNGNFANPWLTINHAVNHGSISAGDTINVRSGTYTERVRITGTGGTVANPITLLSVDGPEQAIIDGSYTYPTGTFVTLGKNTIRSDGQFQSHYEGLYQGLGTVYTGLLQIENVASSNWIIDGFNVVNSRGRGVLINRANNVTFRNGIINGCRGCVFWVNADGTILEDTELTDGGNTAPVSRSPHQMNWPLQVNFQGGNSFIVRRCKIHHNWGEGIGGRRGKNFHIYDNFIWDNYALNVYLHYNYNIYFERNVVWHSDSNAFNRGAGPSSDVVINMESQNGLQEDAADNFRCRNNLILTRSRGLHVWNNQGGGQTSGYIDFLNNTVIARAGGHAFGSITNGGSHSNTIIRNNIFVAQGGGKAFEGTRITQNFHFSNNVWSHSPTGLASGANDIIGYPQFRNAYSSIPSNLVIDPLRYKKSVGSQGIGSGTSLVDASDGSIDGATTDYFGVTRGSAYDIGFDEFTGEEPVENDQYYVSLLGNNSDGLSESTAWNELDQIDWTAINAGDTITLIGPAIFTTTLEPEASGTAVDPIRIRTNGEKIYIRGSRGTALLPEAGATGHAAETATEHGIWGEESYIDIDGGDWHGITIEGWKGHGIYLRKESSHWSIQNVEIRNCGYIENKTTWTGGGITYSGASAAYPNGAGLRLGGSNHRFEQFISHDNGQDAVQSENGDDNNLGNITFYKCWLYNFRKHTIANGRPIGGANSESFNYASHADGIQIYSGGNVNGLTFENCIVGPGGTNGMILGQTGSGGGGSTEIVTNGGFENSGDNLADWTYVEGDDGFITTNSSSPSGSGKSMRVNMSSFGDGIVYQDDISITNGTQYTMKIWMQSSVANSSFRVFLHNPAGALTDHYGLNDQSVSVSSNGIWYETTIVFTATTTTTTARLSLEIGPYFTSGDVLRIDDISIVGAAGTADTTVSNVLINNSLITNNQDNGILGYPGVDNDDWTITNSTFHGTNTKQHVFQVEGSNIVIANSVFDGNNTGADINFITGGEPSSSSNNYQRAANDADTIGFVIDDDDELFADADSSDPFVNNDYKIINPDVANAGCDGGVVELLEVANLIGPDVYGSFEFTETTGLLRNGDFENSVNYFVDWIHIDHGDGQIAEVSGANGTSSAVQITVQSDRNSQIKQHDLSIVKNQRYRLSFWAYSSQANNMDVTLSMQDAPYTNYGLDRVVNLGTSWSQHNLTFIATETSTVGRLQFRFNRHAEIGENYHIDEVELTPIENASDSNVNSALEIGTKIGSKIGVN